MSAGTADGGDMRMPSYARALRSREFFGLYLARVLSDWGDQLARVAIAALVLHRSGSAFFAAAVFAVSFLPKVFGQALLGPYADRLPRRTLMVGCDVLRAAALTLLVVAVIRGMSTAGLLVLLFFVELAGAPFFAASRALLTELFHERALYLRASSLMQMSFQFNQVAGVALGGVVVAALGADRALWVDAATFAVSGVLIAAFVRPRPAASDGGVPGVRDLVDDVRIGIAYLRTDVSLRALMLLAWLMLLVFIAPEAVALPYAASHGASTAAGGLLLAASPFGAFVSVLVISRWQPVVQVRRLVLLAMCVPVPLLVLAIAPPWPVAVVLFFLAGAFQGFMVPLMATFSLLSPDHLRGRLSALAGSGFALVSAVAFVVVGALSDATSPAFAVVLAAAATLLVLVVVRLRWPQQQLCAAAERAYA
ncbi:MFS transporter [Angustibacter sp. Root456]|uniref:MFS transporter n=1 Tax=Angustibacter sp. Root456 TaxID=1736539 RepID=UPI00138F8FF0|nr:MFS transporter [Angustibacter sp. Root456]